MAFAALTGGIASGKSTVASFFNSEGAKLIDADQIAHSVVKKGLPAWQLIVEHFGKKVLSPDGEIDRKYLADIVFDNRQKLQTLNRIVHPAVFEAMDKQLRRQHQLDPKRLVILDIPLLMETGMYKQIPEIILVYVPEWLQIDRLMQRDLLTREKALKRIRAQMPMEQKKALATIIIDNSGSLAKTKQVTADVYRTLMQKKGLPENLGFSI